MLFAKIQLPNRETCIWAEVAGEAAGRVLLVCSWLPEVQSDMVLKTTEARNISELDWGNVPRAASAWIDPDGIYYPGNSVETAEIGQKVTVETLKAKGWIQIFAHHYEGKPNKVQADQLRNRGWGI